MEERYFATKITAIANGLIAGDDAQEIEKNTEEKLGGSKDSWREDNQGGGVVSYLQEIVQSKKLDVNEGMVLS